MGINVSICRVFLLVLSFSIVGGISAAVAPKSTSTADAMAIEKQLKQHGKLIGDLQGKIQKYENALTVNNRKYLQVLDQRKQIEGAIDSLKGHIELQQAQLKQKMERANTVLNGVILSSIDDQHDTTNLISNKMLGAALRKRLAELRTAMVQNEQQEQQLSKLQLAYQDILKNEQDLAQVLSQLESDKKIVVHNYQTVSKQEEQFRSNFHKLKAKQYRETLKVASSANDKGLTFFPPLHEYSDLSFSKKKGVSFYFKNAQGVLAPQSGKVVFKGTVGSFGQVIFIDHGNDLRSVILGHFDPKVEKGTDVLKGDVLGYTNNMGSKIGEIYYEVREKNIALNTITLLDKKSITVR